MRHRFATATALAPVRGTVAMLLGRPARRRRPRRAVSGSKYSTAPPPGWKVPRLADGKPDLQGVWGNNAVTPMTRPVQWKDKTELTDAEVDELKGFLAKFVDQGGDAIFGNLIQLVLNAKDKGEFKQTSYDPTTGNYNQFWMADREWDNRTSLIIDPPDGQFPPLTAEAQARRAAAAARPRTRGPADGPEDRPLSERCISYGAPRTQPNYNSYTQIIQSPDTVVLLQEMIHDARVVPMTDQAAPAEKDPPAARRSARPLGRRHAGRRDHQLHQRFPGIDAGRQADRALHARQPRLHQLAGDRRRSRDVDQALHVHDPPEEGGRTDLRVRLPRRQLRDGRHPRRGAPRGRSGEEEEAIRRFLHDRVRASSHRRLAGARRPSIAAQVVADLCRSYLS